MNYEFPLGVDYHIGSATNGLVSQLATLSGPEENTTFLEVVGVME